MEHLFTDENITAMIRSVLQFLSPELSHLFQDKNKKSFSPTTHREKDLLLILIRLQLEQLFVLL